MKKLLAAFAGMFCAIHALMGYAADGRSAYILQPRDDGLYVVDNQLYIPDLFTYQIDFNTAGGSNIAAGANATGSFTVQAGQIFLWQQACYIADTIQATLTDATRLIPLCTVQLSDSNSGKNLSNSAVPVPSMFGTAQLPFVLPNPRVCYPQTVMSALVTNYAAATNYNLRLSFIGLALYPKGNG